MTIKGYKNLVFKGGGVKSYAYIGALEVLEREGVLDGIENVAGSSAGAMYAALIGMGFSVSEVTSFLNQIDLRMEMREADPDEILENFFHKYGQYDGVKTMQLFVDAVTTKLGRSEVTFRDLHDNYPDMGVKEIYLTGVDISVGKPVVFSYKDSPDMKIVDAVRISGGYPLMYTAVQLEDNHYYVDGGLLDNYPISIFDDKDADVAKGSYKSNPETLGLFLGGREEATLGVDEIKSLVGNVADKFNDDFDSEKLQGYLNELDYSQINLDTGQPITNIVGYMSRLFAVYSTVEYVKYDVDEILIDDCGLYALDLDLTQVDLDNLVNNGRNAAEDFVSHLVL